VGQRQIGGLQRERLVDGRDGGAVERGDRFDRTFLAQVTSNDLVDLVDLDGGDEQRIPALDIRREALRPGPVREVLDPATRVDEGQKRSFFSRRPLGLVPWAIPR
jgi:hypothetical protein